MRRRAAVFLALAALTACADEEPGRQPARESTTSTIRQPVSSAPGGTPVEIRVSEVATELDTVWAIAFAPDGSLVATERDGTIRSWNRISEDGYREAGFTEVDGVVETGEAGLMGLAIDSKARQFVMYTAEDENRIVRLEPDGSQKTLVDGIEAGTVHDGGRLIFGPDGMLYASTGDAGDRANVRRDGLNGKVLRIDPDSGAHEVFSTGHRNPQGLCFAANGKLFSTEHGPDRGDEVNVLEEGQDYGWPESEGTGLINYTPTIAPSGCAVYEHDLIPQWEGDLLFGTLKDQSLRRLDLDESKGRVASQERLYAGEFGRIRDVVVGPDGALYLATSNRDGRGRPGPEDDRILRLAPD